MTLDADADPDDEGTGPPPPRQKKADRKCTGSRNVNGCRLPWDEHKRPYCPWCQRPWEHHRPGDLDAEVQGRARMAAARQAAGNPLSDLDKQALDEYPDDHGSLLT